MSVDDIQIGTGTILDTFLASEPRWERLLFEPERFAVYRKRAERVHTGDWTLQPFLHDGYPTASVCLIPSGAEDKWRAEQRILEEELADSRQRLETTHRQLETTHQRLETASRLVETTSAERDV